MRSSYFLSALLALAIVAVAADRKPLARPFGGKLIDAWNEAIRVIRDYPDGYVTNKMVISESIDAGVEVSSSAPMTNQETMIRLPKGLWMSYQTCSQAFPEVTSDLNALRLPNHVVFYAVCGLQLALYRKNGVEDFQMLLLPPTCTSGIAWNNSLVTQTASTTRNYLYEKQREMKATWSVIMKHAKKDPSLRVPYQFFVWGYCMGVSRNFVGTDPMQNVMLPVADMLNHAEYQESQGYWNRTGQDFFFNTQKPVKSGGILRHSYGSISNADYWLETYGFEPAKNPGHYEYFPPVVTGPMKALKERFIGSLAVFGNFIYQEQPKNLWAIQAAYQIAHMDDSRINSFSLLEIVGGRQPNISLALLAAKKVEEACRKRFKAVPGGKGDADLVASLGKEAKALFSKGQILEAEQKQMLSQAVYHRIHRRAFIQKARTWATSVREEIEAKIAQRNSDYVQSYVAGFAPQPKTVVLNDGRKYAYGMEVHNVAFANPYNVDLNVFWTTPQNTERFIATLPANSRISLNTFLGHKFVVRVARESNDVVLHITITDGRVHRCYMASQMRQQEDGALLPESSYKDSQSYLGKATFENPDQKEAVKLQYTKSDKLIDVAVAPKESVQIAAKMNELFTVTNGAGQVIRRISIKSVAEPFALVPVYQVESFGAATGDWRNAEPVLVGGRGIMVRIQNRSKKTVKILWSCPGSDPTVEAPLELLKIGPTLSRDLYTQQGHTFLAHDGYQVLNQVTLDGAYRSVNWNIDDRL